MWWSSCPVEKGQEVWQSRRQRQYDGGEWWLHLREKAEDCYTPQQIAQEKVD